MNPEEGELRPQLLDRFGLCVDVQGIRDLRQRVEIVERREAFEEDPEAFAADWEPAGARRGGADPPGHHLPRGRGRRPRHPGRHRPSRDRAGGGWSPLRPGEPQGRPGASRPTRGGTGSPSTTSSGWRRWCWPTGPSPPPARAAASPTSGRSSAAPVTARPGAAAEVAASVRAPNRSRAASLEPPSGRQHRLVHGDQEAVVTEVGATLRAYLVGGRPAILGFDEAELATHARGQILMPWPGPGRRRPVPAGGGRPPAAPRRARARQRHPRAGPLGQLGERGALRRPAGDAPPVARARRLSVLPGPGGRPSGWRRPGLEVTFAATNVGDVPAPFGAGAHPYLTVGRRCRRRLEAPAPGGDGAPAPTAGCCPAAGAPVQGTELDFRVARPIGGPGSTPPSPTWCATRTAAPGSPWSSRTGGGSSSGSDRGFPWLLLFSGDALAAGERRRGLAVEPMTCPPDALRSGEDVITLQPGETDDGELGDRRHRVPRLIQAEAAPQRRGRAPPPGRSRTIPALTASRARPIAPSISARSPRAQGTTSMARAAAGTARCASGLAHGAEEEVARQRQLTAHHDPLRAEEVADVGDDDAEGVAGVRERPPAARVPPVGEVEDPGMVSSSP